jgi:ribose 5-phosphate isomerase B
MPPASPILFYSILSNREEDFMKVAIGADPAGFKLKEPIKRDLMKRGIEVFDLNPDGPVLFYEAAKAVSGHVQSKQSERGIIICGTGMGVSIIANKHKGIYAALAECEYTARRAKVVNNTNVLCLGGMILGEEMAVAIANSWINAEYMGGLDDETVKIVSREYQNLVDFEEEVFS